MKVFSSPEELAAAVGTELGASEWLAIEQERVNLFADATDDHQWIHVDPERAKDGPFGTTIAHGYLTLSLLPYLAAQTYRVEGARVGVNYGVNKVRFISPVKVGSRVRAVVTLASVEEAGGGYQVTADVVIEIEGAEKPAAVVQSISRIYF